MKHKTYKSLSKRIKLTGSKRNKKVMHEPHGYNDHLKVNKSALRKNRTKGERILSNDKQTKKILKFI